MEQTRKQDPIVKACEFLRTEDKVTMPEVIAAMYGDEEQTAAFALQAMERASTGWNHLFDWLNEQLSTRVDMSREQMLVCAFTVWGFEAAMAYNEMQATRRPVVFDENGNLL